MVNIVIEFVDIYGPKGGLKKGWAGDVVETYITGRKDNSPQADFEDSELKIVPLTLKKTGALRVKEPMLICMANEEEILANDFMHSHVFRKFKSYRLYKIYTKS